MQPFDSFPKGGAVPLGRPSWGNGTSRTGYGLSLQRLTGQTHCAYCQLDLVGSFQNWLMLSIDHVVPSGQAKLHNIPVKFYEDAINLVLCCSACNGFGNRYACVVVEPPVEWDIESFLRLRDAVFAERTVLIAERRTQERKLFDAKPWLVR